MFLKSTQHNCQQILSHQFVRKTFFSLVSLIMIVGLLFPAAQNPVYAAAVSVPTLLSPDNNVTVTAVDEGFVTAPPVAMPVFSWASVPGATSYQIRFSTDINFATYIPYSTPLTRFTPMAIDRFNDGIWYWQVKVEAPTASDFGQTRQFTKNWASTKNKPQLVSPGEGATIQFYDNPVFSWTPVVGAAYYRIQASIDPDFPANNLSINNDILSTNFQPTEFLKNGLYYWHVIPLDAASHQGTISARGSFVMGYNQVPLLIEPLNNSEPTFTPTFRWTAVRGAQRYDLQYSTDPTFNTDINLIQTPNTTYTPTIPLYNDKNYYWRVRAWNGQSFSDWSNQGNSWTFIKRWYIQPVLLTPIPMFPYVRFPMFSWTPVPGAADYLIEISKNPDVSYPFLAIATENPFYTPNLYDGKFGTIYWRVTPRDRNGNNGKPSIVGQFNSDGSFNSPELVSPLYYYTPNSFPAPDTSVAMNPYEDRSVAYPLFTWQRLFDAATGNEVAHAYRVDVGTDMNPDGTVANVVWTTKTENLSATPKDTEFKPNLGTTYFWQVIPLANIDGTPFPIDQAQFSQVWKTRFDTSKELPATTGAPQLMRPAYKQNYDPVIDPGFDSPEFVEITPALEWLPVQGATQYEVEISRSESVAPGGNFSSSVDTASVQQPVYAPRTSFGQRFLNHLNFGSYYWHVRANVSGSGWTGWSVTWRFEIAAQSHWQVARTGGDATNRLEIARDASSSEVAADYELSALYASQSKDFWYFGFDYSGAGNSTYVIYLDMDNRNNSGATVDKRGFPITTNSAHRPEYAIYLSKAAGVFSPTTVIINHWLGTGWDTGLSLSYLQGTVYTDSSYVEIKVPYQAIGMQVETGTYSLALASIDTSAPSKVMDIVPANPITSGSATINYVTTISEHVTLAAPMTDLGGDPTTFPSFPPFFWNQPTGAPWAGAWVRFYLDAQFSKEVGRFLIQSTGAYYAPSTIDWANDIGGDNTYYWRVWPRYLAGGAEYYGSWSQAGRFERKGFVPQNTNVSVTQATPTFSWDRVEGANQYRLQVDTDPNFGMPSIDVYTSENSFTPINTLPNGKYYWRVEVIRKNGEVAKWTANQSFTLSLPQPTGLTVGGPAVAGTPTFCWDVLSVSVGGNPVLFPYRYQLTVSRGDPKFSTTYDSANTTQNCYTPINRGYDDDTYYWKVAMYDGQGRMGASSTVATFQKAYPIVKPKTPVNGSQMPGTPVFTWTAADGVTPYVFGAARYRLEVYLKPTYTDIYELIDTNQTTYIPTRQYEIGRAYYWRVAMIDRDGRIGPYTNAVITVDKGNKLFLPITRR